VPEVNKRDEEKTFAYLMKRWQNLQRNLKRRFNFLLDHGVRCHALEEVSVGFGLDILDELLKDHAPKAQFRPSASPLEAFSAYRRIAADLTDAREIIAAQGPTHLSFAVARGRRPTA
jgi:hypothetical protein